ncbi:MAG: M23 family metallopeptidase [Candidatus Gracilibacteria bacterium]|nr:M23 family metallopeptidase [Candidatus Gracilibacteria bacterium]
MTKKQSKKKTTSEFIETPIKIEDIASEINKIQINPHKIIGGILSFLTLFLVSIYSFVMGSFDGNDYIKSHSLISKDIYINSTSKDDIVIYKSDKDLSNYGLQSTCKIDQKFVKNINGYYIFYFKFLDTNCKNPYLYLKSNNDKIMSSLIEVNLIDDYSLINKLTDYKSDDLKEMKKGLIVTLDGLSDYSGNSGSIIKNIDFLEKNKEYKNASYLKSKINYILTERQNNYLIPVAGYNLPKDDKKGRSEIPNAGRPYRADTTDGIHHGWDVLAPKYTPVRSLADGIIIRIVHDFKFEDLKKLKTRTGLTFDDKMVNLDIFRGNQIWLKTMNGDVVFYAHLDSINPEIKEGMLVKADTTMGKIGITGIPDKNRTNTHLHFEVAKNPKILGKAGNYTFDDMINWDYLGKGMNIADVFKLQEKTFRK